MQNTIAGNYETTDEEIEVVKAYLDKLKIKYIKVYKYENRNAGDVMVEFPNHLYSLFEIKQESFERFKKYNEYGIDFISSFKFKDGIDENSWKGIHRPKNYKEFISSLDIHNNNFKWGKIIYSYSDVWLFYVKDPNTGEYTHLECYMGKDLHDDFLSYLKENCSFAVNNKSADQLSYSDKHCSATFYIHPSKMEQFKIKSAEEIYHNYNKAFEEILLLNKFSEKKDTEYIGNKIVKTFHLPTCKYSPKKVEKRIAFYSFKEARDNGYSPCNICCCEH